MTKHSILIINSKKNKSTLSIKSKKNNSTLSIFSIKNVIIIIFILIVIFLPIYFLVINPYNGSNTLTLTPTLKSKPSMQIKKSFHASNCLTPLIPAPDATDPKFVFSITNNTTYPIIIGKSAAKTASDNIINNSCTYNYSYGPLDGKTLGTTIITIPTPETYAGSTSNVAPTLNYNNTWAFDLGWQSIPQYVGVNAVFTGIYKDPEDPKIDTQIHTYTVNIDDTTDNKNWNIFGGVPWNYIVLGVTAEITFEQLIQPVIPPTTIEPFPPKFFAPYIDIVAFKSNTIIDVFNATGCKYYTLAFMNYDNNTGVQTWGGNVSSVPSTGIQPFSLQYTPLWYIDKINTIRNNGGDVIISFGGENMSDIVKYYFNKDTDTDLDGSKTLQAYKDVIDKYQLSIIDFDIEGNDTLNQMVYKKRNKVLKTLKSDPIYSGIKIHYTLASLQTGLTEALFILKDAVKQGLAIDVVNIMAMDYGGTELHMGQSAINAAQSVYGQIQQINGPSGSLKNTTIGITPMIGWNDGNGGDNIMIFSLTDAQELIDFAQKTPYVTRLSFWSLNRDNAFKQGDTIGDLPNHSNVVQDQWGFTNIFNKFTTIS